MRIFQCRKILKAAASDCSDGQHAYKHGIWTKSLTNTDATRRSKWFVANEHTTCDHEHSDKLKCGSVEELLFLFIFFVAIFYFLFRSLRALFFYCSVVVIRLIFSGAICECLVDVFCIADAADSYFVYFAHGYDGSLRNKDIRDRAPNAQAHSLRPFQFMLNVCFLFFVLLSGRCCTNNISIVVFYVGCECSRYKYRNMNGTNNQFVECFFFSFHCVRYSW